MRALTKLDIAAIRKADTLVIHLNKANPQGTVRCVKRADYTIDPYAKDQSYSLDCDVVLRHVYGATTSVTDTDIACFGHVSIYSGQRCPVYCMLETLKEGDELTFSFYADAHSNGYIAKAGLHADVLNLLVRRPLKDGKSRYYTWELNVSICPENSARMCRNVPVSRWYLEAASEAA